MAFTPLKRVPGIALVAAANAAEILAFESNSNDVDMNFATPTAANAGNIQKVTTQKDGKGQLTGFLGAEFPTTLDVGDEFAITMVAGTADVSVALKSAQAIPGKCRITHIGDQLQADPGTITVDYEWGFID